MTQQPTVINHFLLLDESNYMRHDQLLIIHQVNQSIHSIRAEALRNPHQEHKLTLLTCNNRRMRCLYSRNNALKAQLVGRSDYNPSAPSNILDGIGSTIGAMRVYNARSESEQFHCTIFTNGIDDDSSKYTESMIASLIDKTKKKGWIFSIIGACESTGQLAHTLGINICCLVKSSDQSYRKEAVLKMLKRRWLRDHDQIPTEDRSVEAA